MPVVNILPFDLKLRFPQHQKVKINTVSYDLYYRWNHVGVFSVLKIVKTNTGVILLNKIITEKTPHEVKDRTTGIVQFTILPWTINSEKAEIWIFV